MSSLSIGNGDRPQDVSLINDRSEKVSLIMAFAHKTHL
jgi:hypothetical protein